MFYRIKDHLQYLSNIQVLLFAGENKVCLTLAKMSYLSMKLIISQPFLPSTDDLKFEAISIQGL